jgi:predicted RNA polymerase sigma factor
VHQVLYLLFSEGYSATQGVAALRADPCEEAARLCYLLCMHRRCSGPATYALMVLVLLHAARLAARLDEAGAVLLMEDRDRSKWDARMIHRAKQFLDDAAEGDIVTTYHLEAGIALVHSTAPSYRETDWGAIVRL